MTAEQHVEDRCVLDVGSKGRSLGRCRIRGGSSGPWRSSAEKLGPAASPSAYLLLAVLGFVAGAIAARVERFGGLP
ncbi:MAG TPA: hypothetical protein VEK07_02940 [Polyangiaceae bacterium]|nr:hypothetical protein [Polyangiaceae bacterium]